MLWHTKGGYVYTLCIHASLKSGYVIPALHTRFPKKWVRIPALHTRFPKKRVGIPALHTRFPKKQVSQHARENNYIIIIFSQSPRSSLKFSTFFPLYRRARTQIA